MKNWLAVVGMPLALAFVLPCTCGADQQNNNQNQDAQVQTKRYSMRANYKAMGSNGGRLGLNRRQIRKGRYAYSDRSFSSRAYQDKASSALRDIHEAAFSEAPEAGTNDTCGAAATNAVAEAAAQEPAR